MIGKVTYKKIDDQGLHYVKGDKTYIHAADQIIVCAGQLSYRVFFDKLKAKGMSPHLIGGAYEVNEIDAKIAIKQGTLLACEI